MLIDSWQAGTLPAVMLWRGPAAVGKATAARWLAQLALCQQERRPCQTCLSCRQIEQYQHPAVHWLQGTAETPIGIDDVRQTTGQLHWSMLAGEQRWWVMADTEYLSEGATNAILKFLEEPPSQLHVVLTTAQPDRLLPTLLSRAAVYYWHTVADEALAAWRPTSMPVGRWQQLVARSAGRPGLMKKFLDHPEQLETEAEYRDMFLAALRSGQPARWPRQLPPTAAASIVDVWELTVRELLLVKSEAPGRRLWPRHEACAAAAAKVEMADLINLVERYLHRYALLQHHVQPRLIFEDLQLA